MRPALLFSKQTVRVAHAVFVVTMVTVIIEQYSQRFGLLTPVPPTFRAASIGAAAFLGILAAAVEREKWMLDGGEAQYNRAERGASAVLMLLVLAVTLWCSNKASESLWMWWAFRGETPSRTDATFTVMERTLGRSGGTVALLEDGKGLTANVRCHGTMCYEIAAGDRLLLSVETGRFAAQRVSLPATHLLRTPSSYGPAS